MVLGIGFLVWLGGLVYFANLIPAGADYPDAATDAIVVLTGGRDRVREGLHLLGDGKGRLLLISGVSREASLADLLRIGEAPPTLTNASIECCITVGYEAGNTAGNAAETVEWARTNDVHSLRLVTADYHMPRSLLEFSLAMPDILVLPHPVFPGQPMRDRWWLRPGPAGLVVSEYHKYAATLLRGWADGLVSRIR